MKKRILGLIVGFLFIGINGFAADGDLIVNGNVGIGTTNPAGKLDISGGIFYLRDRGDNCCTDFRMSQGSGQETHLYSYADGRFGIHKYGAGSAAGEVFSILPGGNVGIGTANPGYNLVVQESGSTGKQLYLKQSNVDNGWVIGDSSSDGYLRFFRRGEGGSPSNNEKFTISTGGNVGIGTVSPSHKLDLAGGFRLNSDGGGNSLHLSAFNDSVTRIDSTGDINLQREVSLMLGGADNYHNTYIWNGKSSELSIVASFIGSFGNVGIGTTDPGGYRLYVNGTAYSTGGWQSSDLRFKDNIKPIESPLDKILSIEGISFDWKKDEFKDKGFPGGRHYGVIAQKVEKVLPEVVKEGPGGEKSVSYTELVPVLIEAMKEQQKEIERLKMEVTQLKTKN